MASEESDLLLIRAMLIVERLHAILYKSYWLNCVHTSEVVTELDTSLIYFFINMVCVKW